MRSRGAISCLLLAAVRAHAQTPGSIVSRNTALFGRAIVDAAQNVYSIGASGPVSPGAAQPASMGGNTCTSGGGGIGPPPFPAPCPNAYVAKADSSGRVVVGTYIGGASPSRGSASAVDSAGNLYVGGSTGSDFPVTSNAAVPSSTAANGGFAVKLSPDGTSFLYSTFLPNGLTAPAAMAVDAQGNAYLAGITSTNHAYVAKLTADGAAFAYVTLLGGSKFDSATALAVDASGSVVVTGSTSSADFPVTASAPQTHLAGARNAFVVRLDPRGQIAFATFLGGSGSDSGVSLQVDGAGNILVGGSTLSLDFPTTPGTFQPAALVPLWGDGPGGFVARLSADGARLIWSTYVMTTPQGVSYVAPGDAGDVYLVAFSQAGFPVTASAPQPCMGAQQGYVVVHLDSQGALADSTYFGGPYDTVQAVRLAGDGGLLLAGGTSFTGTPATTLSQLRFGAPGWTAPACLTPDLFNAATFASGTASSGPSTAPGEMVTLTGFGIGPETGVSYQLDPQGRVPASLAGVSVFVDGQPAPVIYAQSRQVSAIVPIGASGTPAITLQYNSQTFGPFTVLIAAGNPGVFRLHPGFSTQALAFFQDGSLNGPSNPAAAGSVVTLYAGGLGRLSPVCDAGAVNAPVAVNLANGASLTSGAAVVQYAGGAPGLLCGIYQINLQIPPGTPSGLFSVGFEYNAPGFTTGNQVHATLAVK